jgi:hypothetical protein
VIIQFNFEINTQIPSVKVCIHLFLEDSVYGAWDSVVSVATRYWLDIPGFAPRWGQDFPDRFSSTPRPTQPSVQCLPGLFPGGKATADRLPSSISLIECGCNHTSSLCACLASNGPSLCLDVASGLILACSLTSILRVFLIRLKAVTSSELLLTKLNTETDVIRGCHLGGSRGNLFQNLPPVPEHHAMLYVC